MKRVKTEFLSSKLVRFFQQILNVNILALVRDNPSKFSLRGRPESQLGLGLNFGPNFGDLGLFLRLKWPF